MMVGALQSAHMQLAHGDAHSQQCLVGGKNINTFVKQSSAVPSTHVHAQTHVWLRHRSNYGYYIVKSIHGAWCL